MSRLADCFARAKEEKRAALVIYLTAQDPDDATSRRLMLAAAEAGADIIEVGVPWSDPSADGKAIQTAIHRALASGGGMTKSLALTRALRQAHPNLGIVLFGYANPIVVMGPEAFAQGGREAGADGVLASTIPPTRTRSPRRARAGRASTSSRCSRRRRRRRASTSRRRSRSGFIYYVSLTGITGTRARRPRDARRR